MPKLFHRPLAPITIATLAVATLVAGLSFSAAAGHSAGTATAAPQAAISTIAREAVPAPAPLKSRRGRMVTLSAPTRPRATRPFAMVGLTWRSGDPEIAVRVRQSGVWGEWLPIDRQPGRRATEPLWVGDSDGIQTRATGARAGLEVVLIDPGVRRSDIAPRRTAVSPSAPGSTASLARGSTAPMPRVLSRKAWGANEKWRDKKFKYNTVLQQVHVHHTASTNTYSATDVPRMIRGYYRYHVKKLGWGDIGYNFLIDRFGRVWEGRAGGVTRMVRGAHTLGFNQNSAGVAVIGNFDSTAPTAGSVSALVNVAAWKLAPTGLNPYGTVSVQSLGSDLFKKRSYVTLPVIDGHRDTNQTSCPGNLLYTLLPSIRQRVAERIATYGGPAWPAPTLPPTPAPGPTPTVAPSPLPTVRPTPTTSPTATPKATVTITVTPTPR